MYEVYGPKDPGLICFSRENGWSLTFYLTNIKYSFRIISVFFDKKFNLENSTMFFPIHENWYESVNWMSFDRVYWM